MTEKPPSSFVLTDAILFTGETFVEKQALWVKDGKVEDIVGNDKLPEQAQRISLPHAILAPGYIDCQVNGGGNILLNNDPTPAGILTIASAHRQTGTTRLLPTVITDTPNVTLQALQAARQARAQDKSILGLHLEGPHISQVHTGIHNPHYVRAPSVDDIALYRPQDGETLLLTVAPETVPTDIIAQLVKQGVIVSLGHSLANAEQVRSALAAGATGFTHLFNRMKFMTSREANVLGVALDDGTAFCGMIGDSHHLCPENYRLALRAKAEDKLFFVSDAVAPAGAADPQPFSMGGFKLYPDKERLLCVNEDGTLGGSMMTLGQIVPFAIKERKLSPERALRMASAVPAAFLGLGNQLGKLLPGYEADIVALDHLFRPTNVWRAGMRVA